MSSSRVEFFFSTSADSFSSPASLEPRMAEPITTAALADETHAASPDTDDDAESFRKSKAESPTVQLGGMSIADAWNEDNQIQASILMQGLKIHYGKDDQRDGLILSDDSRAKARAAAELWKDDAQRQKFLDEYSITDDKSLDDLWEATEAWLNHANNPIPEQVIQHVDEAVKKCQFVPPIAIGTPATYLTGSMSFK